MNLKEEVRQHTNHYVALGGLLIFSLILLSLNSGGEVGRLVILGGTGLGYLSWGIFHHLKQKELNFGLVLEYFLTAVLVIILILGAMDRFF